MKDLRIDAKIMLMNGVLLVLFIASLLYLSMKIDKGTEVIENQGQTLLFLETVDTASKSFYQMQYWLSDLAVSWLNESEYNAEAARADLDSVLVIIEQVDADLAQSVREQVEASYALSMEAVDAYVDQNRVLGNSLTSEAHKIAIEIDEKLGALMVTSQANTHEAGTLVIRTNKNVRNASIFLMVLVTALGAVSAWFFAKSIVRPIIVLRDAAQKVSEGDLHQHVAIESADEIGQLADVFNEMVANLKGNSEALQAEKAGVERKVEEAIRESEAQQQYLSHSVDRMLTAMEKFADGDLTVCLDAEREDEIGQLYQGFNRAVSNIRDILQKVTEAVESTASASIQISSATEELAAGAQEQSAQALEVAAAMEEMARTIIENATNATQTAEVAENSGKVAQEGGEIVQQTVQKIRQIAKVVHDSSETVERLGVSSNEIGEIISVIQDIADQTNLLALNAAIEAARAGDQGRGFAVVADEVRSLAERTTEATKQIAGMIKAIQAESQEAVKAMKNGREEVSAGIATADKAGDSLSRIVAEAGKVVDMITQIASANEEQSSTSEQISQNVEAISTISNESASGLAEIARSTDNLSRLTDALRMLVSQFQLDASEDRIPTTQHDDGSARLARAPEDRLPVSYGFERRQKDGEGMPS